MIFIGGKKKDGDDKESTQQPDAPTEGDSGLEITYRLIPVADHPLFPGSSTALSVTKD